MAENKIDRDALDALACEIEVRPADAPGLDAVAQAVRDVRRDGERTLIVSFSPGAGDQVEAFAEAERACCSTLQWTVERDADSVRLQVGASPEQIDVLESLFRQSSVA